MKTLKLLWGSDMSVALHIVSFVIFWIPGAVMCLLDLRHLPGLLFYIPGVAAALWSLDRALTINQKPST